MSSHFFLCTLYHGYNKSDTLDKIKKLENESLKDSLKKSEETESDSKPVEEFIKIILSVTHTQSFPRTSER
jgi:hypothetical protein